MASITLLLTTLVLLFPHFINAQNIPVGTALTAAANSNPWRSSPNGDFAFGFQPNDDHFILSIWFDKIPEKTIVWYERSSYPVPRGSTLRLDAANGLVLRHPDGRLLYNTTAAADQIAHASMNDTGNLVIRRRDSSILWESFRHPTDTILPTQTIEIGDTLVSRRTEADFSVGRFYAAINADGNFVFNTKSVPSNSEYDDEYYSFTVSSEQNASKAGLRVAFDSGALISVVRRNGEEQILSPPSIPLPSQNYYRATLNFNGAFTQYYHPKSFGTNPGWSIAESWPENICDTGSGACGYNSICRMENQQPVCQCPPGFSLADPDNPNGDCTPKYVQTCIDDGSTQDQFDMEIINDVDWPKSDYQLIRPSSDEQCRRACLNDCFCGVAIYRDNSCWKKKLPLSNGRFDTDLSSTAFLKFSKQGDVPLLHPKQTRHRQTLIVVVSVLLGSSAFINLLFIAAACLLRLLHNKKLPALNAASSNISCFTYKEVELATNGFKEELGRGSFGIVYKGAMPTGSKSIIAVKKHKNLVGLIGFCDEGPHRLLVYEYMANGTLADFLFGNQMRPSWSQRTEIALGIAKGLAYLHEGCSSQIIHCDIKPHNILLDEYYIARISDFGLAKLLTVNQSKTLTNIRGTKGYVAPEWFRNTQISVKVDVYSFGVVLLEIISCRKILEDGLEFGGEENPILTDWAWDCFLQGRLDALVRNEEEALRDRRMLERLVMVALWCIQEDATLRPTMNRACQMLEGTLQIPHLSNSTSFTSLV